MTQQRHIVWMPGTKYAWQCRDREVSDALCAKLIELNLPVAAIN